MKKLIATAMLATVALQANVANAGCADIYKKYAERRDVTQDFLVAGGIVMTTLPAVGFWGAISPVLGVVYVGGEAALGFGSYNAGFGHKMLPNAFEKMNHILSDNKSEDSENFYKSAKKAYYRSIEKAIVKGKVPRDEQPLTSAELDERITSILSEADSQDLFCKVRGKRKNGEDKHELYTPKAMRDVVVAAILNEEHDIDHAGINLVLHEAKIEVREGIKKAARKTGDAFVDAGQAIKKLFTRKKNRTPISESDSTTKNIGDQSVSPASEPSKNDAQAAK